MAHKRPDLALKNTTHGLSRTQPKTYRTWKDMRSRCRSPKNKEFANYGGRGISVCERWDDFALFYADLGPRPEGHTIDRIDVNGNYEPGNVRWADNETQANNKRCCRMIEHNGETLTLNQWARRFGVLRSTASYRLKIGLSFEEAFSEQDFRR